LLTQGNPNSPDIKSTYTYVYPEISHSKIEWNIIDISNNQYYIQNNVKLILYQLTLTGTHTSFSLTSKIDINGVGGTTIMSYILFNTKYC